MMKTVFAALRLQVFTRNSLVICVWIALMLTTSALSGNPFSQQNAWKISTRSDPMSGEFSAYANSATFFALNKMKFPYEDVTSSVHVGCNAEDEWAYFAFSDAPNLNGGTIKDGYDIIHSRIKWGDELETIRLMQEWGADILHVTADAIAISQISKSDTVMLGLDWYGQGEVYFRYSLAGAAEKIAEIRKLCAENK